MKKLQKRLIGFGLTAVLALSFGTSSFAADTNTNKSNAVNVTVNSGEFSVATSDINSFGGITLSDQPKTYTTAFKNKFTVKDLTGKQAGWRLDVSATQFSDGTSQLPKGSLSIAPVQTISRVGTGSGNLPVSALSSNKIIDNGAVTVVRATQGTGMGVFHLTFPSQALFAVIDATTAKVNNNETNQSNYVSTLTWNLVQAP